MSITQEQWFRQPFKIVLGAGLLSIERGLSTRNLAAQDEADGGQAGTEQHPTDAVDGVPAAQEIQGEAPIQARTRERTPRDSASSVNMRLVTCVHGNWNETLDSPASLIVLELAFENALPQDLEFALTFSAVESDATGGHLSIVASAPARFWDGSARPVMHLRSSNGSKRLQRSGADSVVWQYRFVDVPQRPRPTLVFAVMVSNPHNRPYQMLPEVEILQPLLRKGLNALREPFRSQGKRMKSRVEPVEFDPSIPPVGELDILEIDKNNLERVVEKLETLVSPQPEVVVIREGDAAPLLAHQVDEGERREPNVETRAKLSSFDTPNFDDVPHRKQTVVTTGHWTIQIGPWKYYKWTGPCIRLGDHQRANTTLYVIVGIFNRGSAVPREGIAFIDDTGKLSSQLHKAIRSLRGTKRFLSLKTISGFGLFMCDSDGSHHRIDMDSRNERIMRELYLSYRDSDDDMRHWKKWIHRNWNHSSNELKAGTYSIQLLLSWSVLRITTFILTPVVLSIAIGVYYQAVYHDVQTAWTIASYIVTTAGILVALMAIATAAGQV